MKCCHIKSLDVMKSKCLEENRLILNEFVEEIESRGFSPSTELNYTWVATRFLSECNKPINELTRNDVLTWLETYWTNKQPTTINHRISILSILFDFCLSEGYMQTFPISKFWRPDIQDSLPKFLEVDEQAKLRLYSFNECLQYRAIFEFLISSGVRCQELIDLKVKDVNLTERSATINHGKGGKQRTVHFSERTAFLLKDLIDLKSLPTIPIFHDPDGQIMNRKIIYRIISQMAKKAGLSRKVGAHSLRHTFGTNMVRNGAPLRVVGDELGHKDTATTRIYARADPEQLYAVYKRIMG
ncbi:MAG: tyrosine-type recombinase/integrase [Desulfosporosinus fructosivorans]